MKQEDKKIPLSFPFKSNTYLRIKDNDSTKKDYESIKFTKDLIKSIMIKKFKY